MRQGRRRQGRRLKVRWTDVSAVLLALSMAGCQRAIVDGAKAVAPARLRVTQKHVESGSFYIEGSISYLIVCDWLGREVARREFMLMDNTLPVVDLSLQPGAYYIESYQRPCDGNCALLDPPMDRCAKRFELASGETWFVTVSFSPAKGCSFRRTDAPVRSNAPDAYALRRHYPDCGLDDGRWRRDPFDGDVAHPILERECFADAWMHGDTAELTAYEPTTDIERWDYVVVRANADGSIVELRDGYGADGTDRTDTWTARRCTGLTPGGPADFTLTGCHPVSLSALGTPTAAPAR